MITLCSDRLRIELPEPGEAPNTSTRFDRAGFISEVVLDGMVRFCASEPQNLPHPSSSGRGLCNEYRFNICEDVKIGEYFPKFGIGLFRKEEEGPYIFHKKYKDIIPFEISLEQHADRVIFVTEPMPCQKYALRTTKTISLAGNSLTMTVKAENVGDKEMALEEFCHNFISIDGMAIGSDYQLELPQCPDLGYERLNNRSGRPGSMRGNGKGITFCEFSAIDTDYSIEPNDMEDTVPFTWKMIHKGARAFVECEDRFKPSKIAIWAVDHMLCPEIIHGFHLMPYESNEWTRVWKFDTWINK
ncbi:hypothetical protein [Paenibacillus piri]|uniref:Uncharacterized protein n=1 Tax=Paenibacillus piri TaxID=2547395 RepID=A0A4R5KC58_9BACL|nr:hypothetical protein [Paenibacillus piri]TDF91717.1 hypothetical protein E1757_31795 [Paenibacillus piri]